MSLTLLFGKNLTKVRYQNFLFLLPLTIIIANFIKQHKGWGLEGERSAWRTFGAAGHKGTAKRGQPSKSKEVWGIEKGLEVVDKLEVPVSLPPGNYVLGWRWDCEETAQVWQSCADVNILPPN